MMNSGMVEEEERVGIGEGSVATGADPHPLGPARGRPIAPWSIEAVCSEDRRASGLPVSPNSCLGQQARIYKAGIARGDGPVIFQYMEEIK